MPTNHLGGANALQKVKKKFSATTRQATETELLLPTEAGVLGPETGMEHSSQLSQRVIVQSVDAQARRNVCSVTLDRLGPYRACYSADGRHVLLGGRKGHIMLVKWESPTMRCEVQVQETVRDVCFFRDHTMFAAAQNKSVYMYDEHGTELHCLRNRVSQVSRLDFLRYHWLLATVSSSGKLSYLDVSTGASVADLPTRLGGCDCMRVNPWNALVVLGHNSGAVTMWTPNLAGPAVKILAHKGLVTALAVDRNGRYMASSGRDGTLKVWDVRTHRPLHSYTTPRPACSIDISERGMLAAVAGPSVQIFKDCLATCNFGPYITHLLPTCESESIRFCPYEDMLGVGHSKGFCSMLVRAAARRDLALALTQLSRTTSPSSLHTFRFPARVSLTSTPTRSTPTSPAPSVSRAV
jgi:U3 small nucleolar RNA-associated protein 7